MSAAIRRTARALVRVYWLFACFLIAIGIVHAVLNRINFRPKEDAWALFAVSMIIALGLLIQFGFTREWTLLSLGLFGLAAFDAGLYGLSSQATLFGWHATTQSDVNWLRADLFVSGPLMLIGLLHYAYIQLHPWWSARMTLAPVRAKRRRAIPWSALDDWRMQIAVTILVSFVTAYVYLAIRYGRWWLF